MSFTPWKTAIELLYPARCPVCDRVLPYGKKICGGCRKIPEPVGDIVCLKCGKPLEEEALALFLHAVQEGDRAGEEAVAQVDGAVHVEHEEGDRG